MSPDTKLSIESECLHVSRPRKRKRSFFSRTCRKRQKQCPVLITNYTECLFCKNGENSKLGTFFSSVEDNIAAHQFCLLFSCGLPQRGKDQEGFDGFLIPDIMKEAQRTHKLECKVCGKRGANSGCSVKSCRRVYHFACGLSTGFQFIFAGAFNSFCKQHRSRQNLSPIRKFKKRPVCPICLEEINSDCHETILKTPCCKNVFMHKECVERQASISGYFFRCPTCNNEKLFSMEMATYGIYIPSRDAAWEKGGAYSDLLQQYDRCDYSNCKCVKGRSYFTKSGQWNLLRCYACGQSAVHVLCLGKLYLPGFGYVCADCNQVICRAKAHNLDVLQQSYQERWQRHKMLLQDLQRRDDPVLLGSSVFCKTILCKRYGIKESFVHMEPLNPLVLGSVNISEKDLKVLKKKFPKARKKVTVKRLKKDSRKSKNKEILPFKYKTRRQSDSMFINHSNTMETNSSDVTILANEPRCIESFTKIIKTSESFSLLNIEMEKHNYDRTFFEPCSEVLKSMRTSSVVLVNGLSAGSQQVNSILKSERETSTNVKCGLSQYNLAECFQPLSSTCFEEADVNKRIESSHCCDTTENVTKQRKVPEINLSQVGLIKNYLSSNNYAHTFELSYVEVQEMSEFNVCVELNAPSELNPSPELNSASELNESLELNASPELNASSELNASPKLNGSAELDASPELNSSSEINVSFKSFSSLALDSPNAEVELCNSSRRTLSACSPEQSSFLQFTADGESEESLSKKSVCALNKSSSSSFTPEKKEVIILDKTSIKISFQFAKHNKEIRKDSIKGAQNNEEKREEGCSSDYKHKMATVQPPPYELFVPNRKQKEHCMSKLNGCLLNRFYKSDANWISAKVHWALCNDTPIPVHFEQNLEN